MHGGPAARSTVATSYSCREPSGLNSATRSTNERERIRAHRCRDDSATTTGRAVMTDRPWTFEHYRSSGQEGHATVPGGVLKYRLTGPATAANVVVFENGWSAPFPYAMWLEQALAPHVRVLSYDRAGIGDKIGRAHV